MKLRIRPGLVLVWRSPTVLQVGAPDPLAIVDDVDTGLDWLIARLRAGTTEAAAIAAAVRHGATSLEARAAIDALRDVLVEVDHEGRPVGDPRVRSVGVRASDHDRHRMVLVAAALEARGAQVRRLAADEVPAPSEALIEVADFVVPPRRAQPLMAADAMHVALLFGDHAIEVSPRIVPGETACLRCADLAHAEADPAWPIVATQLVEARAPRSSDDEIALVASLGLRAATEPGHRIAHRLDQLTGELTTRRWEMHPSCGCQALPGSVTAPDDDHARQQPRSSREGVPARA